MTDKNLEALGAFAGAVDAACKTLETSGADVGFDAIAKLCDTARRLASQAYRVRNAASSSADPALMESITRQIGQPPAAPSSRGAVR